MHKYYVGGRDIRNNKKDRIKYKLRKYFNNQLVTRVYMYTHELLTSYYNLAKQKLQNHFTQQTNYLPKYIYIYIYI